MSKLAASSGVRSSIDASTSLNERLRRDASRSSSRSIAGLRSTTVTRAPAAAYKIDCHPPPEARHSTSSPCTEGGNQPRPSSVRMGSLHSSSVATVANWLPDSASRFQAFRFCARDAAADAKDSRRSCANSKRHRPFTQRYRQTVRSTNRGVSNKPTRSALTL